MNDPRGSRWRKWDLHVHTPASLVQHYGGNTDQAWDRFIEELEGLPDEFKVLGINDYIFLDGYERIIKEKEQGRLGNIELILPVIELRLDKFAGTTGRLNRVNLHVIFSNRLSVHLIKSQFIASLSRYYQLTPQYNHTQIKWNAVVDRESLEDLGRKIIDSVPEDRRHQYQTPIQEGFNNLCVSFDQIRECLHNTYLEGQFITAVGKTEWADIVWSDHSIAEKKNVINGVDLVFISAENVTAYHNAKNRLKSEGVNDQLIDCSDAHYFSDSEQKDRIGKCFTWIKADPTFAGLKQASLEPDRIFVGDRPEKLRHVDNHRTKYIRSVQIRKKEDSDLSEIWFDNSLEFNPNLVAIIGNKGSGKSALTDVIALLGNSHTQPFSFLCKERFRDPKLNKAQHFVATIEWESGDPTTLDLSHMTPDDVIERLRYIPQNFFEVLCNELQVGEGSKFTEELKSVIFAHIPEHERQGFNNLDELANRRTVTIQQRIDTLRQRLGRLNSKIVELEDKITETHRQNLRSQIKLKQAELTVHEANQPESVPEPSDDTEISRLINKHRAEIDKIDQHENQVTAKIADKTSQQTAIQSLLGRLTNFGKEYEQLLEECEDWAKEIQLDLNSIVQLSLDVSSIESSLGQTKVHLEQMTEELKALNHKRAELKGAIEELRNSLSEAESSYHNYVREFEVWEERRDEIIGSSTIMSSIKYYEHQLDESINKFPDELVELRCERTQLVEEIFVEVTKIRELYSEFYEPVQAVIHQNNLTASNEYAFNFLATIDSPRLPEKLLQQINQRVKGPFQGRAEGEKSVRDLLSEYDFNSIQDVLNFPERILQCLSQGQLLSSPQEELIPATVSKDLDVEKIGLQLLSGVSREEFYDFLFSLKYLQPNYRLQLNGRDLHLLSPGERGALLLVFYLLVDPENCPLIIDQPDENLDSESIFNLLVPFIREAKKNRQIFIITHNPNLAVVCDAEQIIHAEIDKANGNKVTYTSGAIENPDMNARIVDVLEGTWPAFSNRDSKYFRPNRTV